VINITIAIRSSKDPNELPSFRFMRIPLKFVAMT